jgi:hypothetical protein
MAEQFPSGSIVTLDQIDPDDRITLSDFGGSQFEKEGKYTLAIAFQNLHKRKLLDEPGYDPADPLGTVSGVSVTAQEMREAFIEQERIPIPATEDETFVSQHLIIRTFDLPDDETNTYYKTLIDKARSYLIR